MKTVLLSLITCLLFGETATAQIPNNGFENWTTNGTIQTPDNWSTLNNYTSTVSVYTAEMGTPGSPGNSYLKLTSKTVGATVVNGIAVCGTLNTTTFQPEAGFAYDQMPVNFTGKWQHMIYGSSQGSVTAILTRWDSGSNSRVTVATANQTLSGMAMSWANFSIPFVYTDSNAPDSCMIVLKASGASPTDQDYLWVDNLGFSGNLLGIQEWVALNEFSCFPNPAKNQFAVTFTLKEPAHTTLRLTSLNGTVVYQQQLEAIAGINETTVVCEGLTAGNYLMQLSDGTHSTLKQIILQ
jgi:Secretion system C-terminal sorting domain